MDRRLVTFVLCGASLAGRVALAQRPSTQPDPEQWAKIKSVVDGYIQPFLAQANAPGAIVGVSLRGQRYFFPYGSAMDDGTPFTPSTLVEIGSCTKVFTTTLFALALNRGQMKAEAPAQTYMPRGYTLQAMNQGMTPLQLADFTSGMPDSPTDLPQGPIRRNIEHYTPKDFLNWASGYQPDQAPPAPYLYSNAGIGLLSYLIMTATNQPWETQINRELLAPLGMTDTQLRPSPEQRSRLAQGHRPNGNDATPWPIFAWYAAGGLRSTATDMLRFGEANLGHKLVDGRSVPDELISAMRRAQAPLYLLPKGDAKQGMAWVTNLGDGTPDGHPEVLKNGGTDGFGSVILLNPSKDAAIFIAVNHSKNNPAPVAVEIGRHLTMSGASSLPASAP